MIKQPSTIAIFSEWQRLSFTAEGGLRAPHRESIKPQKLSRYLPDLFLLEIDRSEPVFRLSGTRICSLFGRELKGTNFLSLWPDKNRPALIELLRNVSNLSVPALSTHDGISLAGRHLSFELLIAPLQAESNKRINMLGSLSIIETVSWAGADPLVLANMKSVVPLDPNLDVRVTQSRPPLRTARRVNSSESIQPIQKSAPEARKPRLSVINGGKS